MPSSPSTLASSRCTLFPHLVLIAITLGGVLLLLPLDSDLSYRSPLNPASELSSEAQNDAQVQPKMLVVAQPPPEPAMDAAPDAVPVESPRKPVESSHLACQRLGGSSSVRDSKLFFDSILPPLDSIILTRMERSSLLRALSDRNYFTEEYDRTDMVELGQRMRIFALISRVVKDLHARFQFDESFLQSEAVCSPQVRELMRLYVRMQNFLFPWIRSSEGIGESNEVLKLWNHALTVDQRGIVLCGGDMHFDYIATLIWSIREIHQCKIPIEIFYMGEEDLSEASIFALEGMAESVRCRNIYDYFDDELLMLEGWDIKPFAILAANASEVMIVDVDAGFLQSPEVLFSFKGYKDTGAYFFHDRTWPDEHWDSMSLLKKLNPSFSFRVKQLRVYDGITQHEMESGVVLIDKSRRFFGILGTCKLLDLEERPVVYQKIYGDKEAYWLAFEMMDEEYSFSPWYPGSIGYTNRRNTSCGRLLHFDEAGDPFWWNGGFKDAEKHAYDYEDLEYLTMEVYDDGGFIEERFGRVGKWTSRQIWNYCMSSSPRGTRILPKPMRHIASEIIRSNQLFVKISKKMEIARAENARLDLSNKAPVETSSDSSNSAAVASKTGASIL